MVNAYYLVFIIALVLLIVGGVNWGLIALNENWDVVKALFPNEGLQMALRRIVYGLVGLSALLCLVLSFTKYNDIFGATSA